MSAGSVLEPPLTLTQPSLPPKKPTRNGCFPRGAARNPFRQLNALPEAFISLQFDENFKPKSATLLAVWAGPSTLIGEKLF